jgi:hypothetical protein
MILDKSMTPSTTAIAVRRKRAAPRGADALLINAITNPGIRGR